MKIVITRRIFPEVVAALKASFEVDANEDDRIYTPDELGARLADADAAIACITEKVDAALLARAPRLKVVANIATGYNNIDVQACTARGVMVTNTPGVLEETTADLTFALLLAAARRITEAEGWLRAGDWKKAFALQQFTGMDAHHATLGIVGMGRIGQAIARRARGFDMTILYHNRTPLDATVAGALGAALVPRDELFRRADFVVVMVPYSPATHHLVGAAEIALMKKSAILVNTARGGVVDDGALIAALESGRIAGAALDVFENEPKFDARFLALKNVVLTPHIGSATQATRRRMAQLAADNVAAALGGALPPNLVNRETIGDSTCLQTSHSSASVSWASPWPAILPPKATTSRCTTARPRRPRHGSRSTAGKAHPRRRSPRRAWTSSACVSETTMTCWRSCSARTARSAACDRARR